MSIEIKAPMAGKILEVKVKVGNHVGEDDVLFILEAMKMEQPILATEEGTVQEIRVEEGQAVDSGRVLAVLG